MAAPLEASRLVVLAALVLVLAGMVGDAMRLEDVTGSCDAAAVDEANSSQLHEILAELSNTTYFRLFKVNLARECRFWDSDGKKMPVASCGSSTAEDSAAAGAFGASGMLGAAPPVPACSLQGPGFEPSPPPLAMTTKVTDDVDMTISSREKATHATFNDCDSESFWLNICDNIPTDSAEYVNLQLNPERNTGYNGSHIWKAIYDENCFKRTGQSEGMCFEERVLYRMLSGMHSSISIQIATNYFSPGVKGRTQWESNPDRYMSVFSEHPERLKNLYFTFLVMLRAINKASPHLMHMSFNTGQSDGDHEHTQALMRRLVDSPVLSSCGPVFSAFDESLMFQENGAPSAAATLKTNFKDVFMNISAILDCVACQKCKLHGKMAMLGLGSAMKILLVPDNMMASSIDREELVALINTAAKFSESIKAVAELTKEYWSRKPIPPPSAPPPPNQHLMYGNVQDPSLIDQAVGAIAIARSQGLLSAEQEDALLDLSFDGNEKLLILGKHYGQSLDFARHAVRIFLDSSVKSKTPDLVVIGGGLAGMTAALQVIDRGGRVILIDKDARLGGNSAKASSGINGMRAGASNDSTTVFRDDMVKTAGLETELVETLTEQSARALEWIEDRIGVKLDQVVQMGGHTYARTYRCSGGIVGAELVFALEKELKKYNRPGGPLTMMLGRRMESLIKEGGNVVGVKLDDDSEVRAGAVLLATGGYANDRDVSTSLLREFRPDTQEMPTTNILGSTGDGIKIVRDIGGSVVELDKVQIHPTGFVDPKDPSSMSKTLCAEMLRGVGGIMLNSKGHRFVNELGPRDYVTNMMLDEASRHDEKAEAFIVLNDLAAKEASRHVTLYTHKKLLTKVQGAAGLAEFMGVDEAVVKSTLELYNGVASRAATFQADGPDGRADQYGKVDFKNLPMSNDLPYYIGRITPVLHYTMGGVAIDKDGRVLFEDATSNGTGTASSVVIPGLYAAGEVTGNIHGKNRLGGNGLLECVVFGLKVGDHVKVVASRGPLSMDFGGAPSQQEKPLPEISREQLKSHNQDGNLWVALYDKVYDFSAFAPEHPGGPESITEVAGGDGTEIFGSVHNTAMLEDFEPVATLV